MKNKLIKLLFTFVTIFSIITVCGCKVMEQTPVNKYKITTTLFPQYEFVKAIIGEDPKLKNLFEVSLIVPPGVDAHTFDPRLTDLIEIKKSDLFIYTSDDFETWVQDLNVGQYTKIIDLSLDPRIELLEVTDEDHEESSHHDHHTHHHDTDPHFWVYPVYASYMVDTIRNAMIELLKKPKSGSTVVNQDLIDKINQNADKYQAELLKIDEAIKYIRSIATNTTMYFASPFSFYYWSHYYDLEYVLTYATCSTEVEPPMTTIIHVINEIREHDIKVIYVKELLSISVAKMIAEQTGAEIVLLHSCHNISKVDIENNVTFLKIMQENVKYLAMGLNVDLALIPSFNESEVNTDVTN